jgi:hypothetical protein
MKMPLQEMGRILVYGKPVDMRNGFESGALVPMAWWDSYVVGYVRIRSPGTFSSFLIGVATW